MNESLGASSVLRLIRLLAAIGATLVLVVIVSSAYLRLSQAGLSCADWPACYGNVAHATAATTAQRGARIAHRFAATTVMVVLLVIVAVSLRQRPRLRKPATIAAAAVAIALALAMIGAVSSESTRTTPLPAVTLANLGGGFALLALFAWLRETTLESRHDTASRALRVLAALLLVATVGQAALGGLVSARFAGLACPGFPLCGADAPAGALWQTLDPSAPLAVDASGSIVRPPALAALHWAHRVVAHVVLLLAVIACVMLVRARRVGIAALLGALVVATLAFGATSVLNGLPLATVLLHNLAAALLVAAAVIVNARLRAAR
jgi:cytochrome c oxidase assembly protein subunit 15